MLLHSLSRLLHHRCWLLHAGARSHADLLTARPNHFNPRYPPCQGARSLLPLPRGTTPSPLVCHSMPAPRYMIRAVKGIVGRPVQLFFLFASSSRCNRSQGATLHLPSVPGWSLLGVGTTISRRCCDDARGRTPALAATALQLQCRARDCG